MKSKGKSRFISRIADLVVNNQATKRFKQAALTVGS